MLPGVASVGAAHPLPLRWPMWTSFTIAGHVDSPGELPSAGATVTEPGYFETLSIPLIRGRIFTAHDNDPKSASVAIINQSFARQFFPGEDPIGRYFTPKFDHRDKALIGRQIPAQRTIFLSEQRSAACSQRSHTSHPKRDRQSLPSGHPPWDPRK